MPTAEAPTAASPPARRKKPPSFTKNLRKKKSSPVCAKEIFECPHTFITPSATSIASSPQSRYDFIGQLAAHRGSGRGRRWRLFRRNAAPRRRACRDDRPPCVCGGHSKERSVAGHLAIQGNPARG